MFSQPEEVKCFIWKMAKQNVPVLVFVGGRFFLLKTPQSFDAFVESSSFSSAEFWASNILV